MGVMELISDYVIPSRRPAVFISGGLDSTILLHHLSEQCLIDKIHTFTVGLPEDNEFDEARNVAEYYKTIHHEVVASSIMDEYHRVAPLLDRPRFNLWPLYLYREAKACGCENVYIGEGLDEHFGGYENKPPMTPQESWGPVLEWSVPTHRQLAKIFGLKVHTPYFNIPLTDTISLWRDPHIFGAKRMVKKAYRGVIPDRALERPKIGGRFNWENPGVWRREFTELGDVPQSHEEANRRVNLWIIRIWLEGQTETYHGEGEAPPSTPTHIMDIEVEKP